MTMTRVILSATLLSLLTAAPACGGGGEADKKTDKGGAAGQTAQAAPLDPKVAKAVEIADAISKTPGDADAILEKNGLDREKLDAMMFEIAKDPALAAQYQAARAD